jgi:hypothetical protein
MTTPLIVLLWCWANLGGDSGCKVDGFYNSLKECRHAIVEFQRFDNRVIKAIQAKALTHYTCIRPKDE